MIEWYYCHGCWRAWPWCRRDDYEAMRQLAALGAMPSMVYDTGGQKTCLWGCETYFFRAGSARVIASRVAREAEPAVEAAYRIGGVVAAGEVLKINAWS